MIEIPEEVGTGQEETIKILIEIGLEVGREVDRETLETNQLFLTF